MDKKKLLKKLRWWGIPLALVGGFLASPLFKKGIEQCQYWIAVANVREAVEEGSYTKLYQLLQSSRKDLNENQWNKLEARLDSMIFWPGVNLENYTLIPQRNIYIGKEEDWIGNKRWYGDNKEAFLGADYNTWHRFAERGLLIPPLDAFMVHYKNVSDAVKGKRTLQNGLGNPISKEEIKYLWRRLSGKKSCLLCCETSLDAHFVEENGDLYLETEKAQKRELLEKCVMEDCYVDLEFNRQGLPVSKARDQEYKPGENIFYKYPRKGSFARFHVESEYHLTSFRDAEQTSPWIGASLECNVRSLSIIDILPCVEGSQVSVRNIVKNIDDLNKKTLYVQATFRNILDQLAEGDQNKVIQGLNSLLNENAIFEINKGTNISAQYLDKLFSAEALYIKGFRGRMQPDRSIRSYRYDQLSFRDMLADDMITTLVPIIHKSLELAGKMNKEKKQDYIVQLLEAYGKITKGILDSERGRREYGREGNWSNGVPNQALRGTSRDPEVINMYHNPNRRRLSWQPLYVEGDIIDRRRTVFGDLTPLLDSLQNLETQYGYKVLTLGVEKEKEKETRRK